MAIRKRWEAGGFLQEVHESSEGPEDNGRAWPLTGTGEFRESGDEEKLETTK